MAMDIHDEYLERRRNLGRSEFEAVLGFYNIKRDPSDPKKIHCPSVSHTDRHASCQINKDGTGCFCYVCWRYFSPVDIVMEHQRLPFRGAFEFLLSTILHENLPNSDRKGEQFILSWDELNFIGFGNAGVRSVQASVNYTSPLISHEEESGTKDANGFYTVCEDSAVTNLQDLYKKDPMTALEIMYAKADETVSYYNRLAKKLKAYMEDFKKSGLCLASLTSDIVIDSDDDLWQTCCKKQKELTENLAKAKKLRNILRGKRNRLRKTP